MKISEYGAVVTGGASGMGAATARMFAKRGAKVILFDLDEARASQLANELGGMAFTVDVTDEAQVQSAVDQAAEQINEIRFCVNCAGICPANPVVRRGTPMALSEFSKVISVNLIGSFNVLRCVAAHMSSLSSANEDGERGVIVNTASIAAYEGQIGQAAYAASKGGIVGMTLPIAREFARYGIRVMTIAPGLIDTPMLAGLPDEVQSNLKATLPFPSRFGKTEEYASLVEHIIGNPLLNGSVIRLDSALRMQPK